MNIFIYDKIISVDLNTVSSYILQLREEKVRVVNKYLYQEEVKR